MSLSKSTRDTETKTIQSMSLLMLATVALATALIYTRSVMVPFVLSLLLSYLMGPCVDWIQDKLRLPRWLAILALVLGVLLLFVALVAIITSSVTSLGHNAAVYEDRLVAMTERATNWLDSQGLDLGQQDMVATVKSLPLFSWLRRTLGGVMTFLSNFFLVLVFVIYLVARRVPESFGQGAELRAKIRSYLITKIMLSCITGVTVGLILFVLGVDLALVFGLLAFVLNFIPNVGSIVATLLPLPVVLMQLDNPLVITLAIVLPGAVQMVVGNVIEPKMLGKSVDLNPITILLGLMFWGLIWGVVGMLLATPLTAVLKVQLERFEVTRPMAVLMGTGSAEPMPPSPAPEAAPPEAEK